MAKRRCVPVFSTFKVFGAGKSDATKCEGFLRGEGNLVLSDGRIAVGATCRACDFNGWVWPLLGTDDVILVVDGADDERRMLVCRHVVQRQECQLRLFYIAVVV